MALLDLKPAPGASRRRLGPTTILIVCCLVCLIVGTFFGRYIASTDSSRAEAGGISSLTSPLGIVLTPSGSKQTTKAQEKEEPLRPICLNTCSKAKDGVCDDGRPVPAPEDVWASRKVFCDLGTDCEDCGPWTPSKAAPWADSRAMITKQKGPVARLLEMGVPVNVKATITKPQFTFAYSDPDADFDVSNHFHHGSIVESSITKIFYHILKDKCSRSLGKASALFVDVGANFGWFSVFAASLGCRVLAFEPVPHFQAFFEYSTHLNGLADLIDIRGNVVSHEANKDMVMVVPSRGIWGTAGIQGMNIDKNIKDNTNMNLSIPSVRLEDVVKEDVLLLKVDVEGWEWSVMQGAKRLQQNYNVENIVMEYSPGVPERWFLYEEIKKTVRMLMDMCKGGYRVGHIGDTTKHADTDLASPIAPLEEITLNNLIYDLHDVGLYENFSLGCPLAPELKYFKGWGTYGCGQAVPEDLHPYSLRSTLAHNTNIWAAKTTDKLPLKGVVGVIKLGVDLKENPLVGPEVEFGQGGRYCKDLPLAVMVKHRCPCNQPEHCGEEEKVVRQVAREGRLASNYLLPRV